MPIEAVIFDLDGTLLHTELDFDLIRQQIGIDSGPVLEALEHITRLLVSRRLQRRAFLSVDVQEYRLRHEERLRELARRMARNVEGSGRPITLRPMSPRDRRIVHLELQENPEVTTQSTGEGDQRRVMILPGE